MVTQVYFDYDGVIQDTKVIIKQMQQSFEINNSWEFYSNIDWSVVLNSAPYINDSINTILYLSKIVEISILTCFCSYSEAESKCRHINKILPCIPIILCPYGVKKSSITFTKGRVLVDDNPCNVSDWIENNGYGLLFGMTSDIPYVLNMIDLKIRILSKNYT